MEQIILYHGSPNQQVSPQYGLGDEKHDYGKGFYLTGSLELAKEWAVCRPDERNGWVHKFSLDITDLRVLDYGIDSEHYDVIKGWRANASYFYIAREFVRDNIDVEILEELLSLGGLGIQYCIKSERAYESLAEIKEELTCVDFREFNEKYNERDVSAREKMRKLVDSDANKVANVFSTILER